MARPVTFFIGNERAHLTVELNSYAPGKPLAITMDCTTELLSPGWSAVIRKTGGVFEVVLQPPPAEAPHPAAFINAIAEEGTKAEAVEWLRKLWNENCELRLAATPQVQDTYSQLNQDAHPGSALPDIMYHLPEVLWAEAQRFGNRYDAAAGDWTAQGNIRFGRHLLGALANALSAARARAQEPRPLARDVTKLSEAAIG